MPARSILVRIQDVAYAVTRLDPHPSVASKAYRLEKRSLDGAVYDVHVDGHGPHCECLGFLRWNKPCKHIRTLQGEGML